MTTTMRYSAAASRNLSDDGVRRLVASYTGRYAAVIPDFKMQPGMLYTQVRAISARINQNYDAWPSEELKKSFRTFLGKPVFVNHQNFDPEKARGRVVAARYRENGDDKYIEVIQEIDAVRFPKLAKEIHEGGLDSVSMGVEAGFTKCSVCDNTATDISDMCDHVKYHKGEKLAHAQTGEPTLVYENCYKLGFFELSYVFDPADETAVVSRVVVANNKTAKPRKPRLYRPDPENQPDYYKLREEEDGKPGPIGQFINEHAEKTLNRLERDRKIQKMREFLKRYPQEHFLTASAASDVDWADLGRQAFENGQPGDPEANPDVALVLQQLSPEEADFVRARYQQGYEMASRTARRRYAVEAVQPTSNDEQRKRPDEDNFSTMKTMTPGDMMGMPSAPTQYEMIPGAGWVNPDTAGGSSSGGGSIGPVGGGSSSGGGGNVGEGGIMDVSRPLYEQLKALDPNADIGGYREDSFGEHSRGALDYMTTDENVAAQVRQMGFDAGAPWTIWQQQMYYPDGRVEPMPDRGDPTQNHMDHVHIGPLMASRRLAWGEIEAPEDIDTLRDQSEDDGSDDFHHYVESPKELQTPDFDKAERLDRAQEEAGLDTDRRAEDVEEVGIPTRLGGRKMPRYRYAEGDPSMGGDPAMMGGDPAMQAPPTDPNMGQMGLEEELALLNQAQGDLAYAESSLYGGDPAAAGGDPMMGDPSMMMGDPSMGAPEGEPEAAPEGEEEADPSSVPPQIEARRRPVRNTSSQKKVRRTQKGRSMGINLSERGRVASRGRRIQADESGHVDGGPYGRNDQGEQEEVFLSQTPAEEAPADPVGDKQISNTENNLVARVQRGTEQLRRDAAALARLRQQKAAAMRRHADDNIIEPTTVNPPLSGTDEQSLKGDDFTSVALDNVQTQPKDASIHAFAAFDDWLARTTGKTARQHGNANFIRRQAARYIKATGIPLGNLFPTLEKVLVEARRVEANREANMKRRANESLPVAAPGDRIDVEAPVEGVTDADAQASQYNLSDYGGNASDNLADPELGTESQFWAPGEGQKTSNRTADAVAAVRCAEAYINAGLAPASEKWKLIARFQTMRHATVVDRTRLLEAKNEVDRSAASRQRSAAVSRGTSIPRGLGSGQRTAQTNRVAASDPSSDSLLFFK